MIRMCDTDGDGQVTFDEFYKLFAAPPDPKDKVALATLHGTRRSQPKLDEMEATPSQGPQQGHPGFVTSQAVQQAMDAEDITLEQALQKFTGGSKMKPSYIKRIYKKFQAVDSNNSGKIDYYEFLTVMEADDNYLMQRMFSLFDLDSSGEIELKEFIVGMSNYTSASKGDRLKFAFVMFDEDGSGKIERSELIKILHSNFVDDRLGKDVLEAKADQIYDKLGLARKAAITYEQFMQLAKTHSTLLYPAMVAGSKLVKATSTRPA
mmetsp:Transcript_70297/g.161274  ORF Transcript_70297/g.161274 Transcript_70297/m.161274 type:complete len:264 (+) Transcript_70297:260-1051(+)